MTYKSKNIDDPYYPRLLNEAEAAAMLRKSVHWLRRMRVQGETNLIPFRRIGSSIRYDERDVLNFIEQAKQFETKNLSPFTEFKNS